MKITMQEVLCDIYARSALHHIDPGTTPKLLTEDSRDALERRVHDELDTLALILGGTATHTGSVATLAVSLVPEASEEGLTAAIHRILALTILAEAVYTEEPHYAESLMTQARSTLTVIRRYITSTRATLPRITPHLY